MSNPKEDLIATLKRTLANTYVLYLKTQNFHWNVKGPMFHSLHTLFEEQYTEQAAAIDEIAERLRALGVYAPGSFSAFKELSQISESEDYIPAVEMVKELASDQQVLRGIVGEGIAHASELGDDVTADLLTQRAHVHEKNAWMLSSSLGG